MRNNWQIARSIAACDRIIEQPQPRIAMFIKDSNEAILYQSLDQAKAFAKEIQWMLRQLSHAVSEQSILYKDSKKAIAQAEEDMRSWTPNKIIEQLEKCEFIDRMGHKLEMNDAYCFLKKAITVSAPKFFINQIVSYEVTYKSSSGEELKQWTNYYIIGINRASSSENIYYTYDLSSDPCQPYHYGTVNFTRISENCLEEV